MYSNSSIDGYPVPTKYRKTSRLLRSFLIVNLFVLIVWIIYLIKLLIAQIARYFKISKNRFPINKDYEEQYRIKVDILKYIFLICCFTFELLSEFFGFMTGDIASHDDKKPHIPLRLSSSCELIPVGWLYRLYKFEIDFLLCQSLWYCCTILALSLFMWMMHVQIRAYKKSLNQTRYVLPIIAIVLLVITTFVLSAVKQTAIFGSVFYCVLVLLIYVVTVYKVIRFGKILREIRNESIDNVKDSYRKGFYINKLYLDEQNFKKYGVLVVSILFLLGLDLFSQFVYNYFNVFIFSILINPCWFDFVYKINLDFRLSNGTINSLVVSTDYLIIIRNITSCCYILGFICLSIGIVFLPKMYSVFRKLCKREDSDKSNELEEKLIK